MPSCRHGWLVISGNNIACVGESRSQRNSTVSVSGWFILLDIKVLVCCCYLWIICKRKILGHRWRRELCYRQMSMYMDLELFCLPPTKSQKWSISIQRLLYKVSQVWHSLEILDLYFQLSLWDENWLDLRFDFVHFKINDCKLTIAETNFQPFLLWVICTHRTVLINFSQVRVTGLFHI